MQQLPTYLLLYFRIMSDEPGDEEGEQVEEQEEVGGSSSRLLCIEYPGIVSRQGRTDFMCKSVV